MTGFLRTGLLVLVLLAPAPALAHLPIEGVGGFYGGLLHPILVPTHVLSLLALGVCIGQQRARRMALLIFALALVAGLIAIAFAVVQTVAGDILLANAAVLGILIATARTLPQSLVWIFAAIAGAALALDSPPQAVTIAEGYAMLIGTALGACIALETIVEVAARLARPWQRLAVRILGSWIAASSILALAIQWR
jgi:urease accessory protein